MDCYLCALDSQERKAVANCRHCGVGLCADHWREADSYRVGGMRYGCAHQDQVDKVLIAETDTD